MKNLNQTNLTVERLKGQTYACWKYIETQNNIWGNLQALCGLQPDYSSYLVAALSVLTNFANKAQQQLSTEHKYWRKNIKQHGNSVFVKKKLTTLTLE